MTSLDRHLAAALRKKREEGSMPDLLVFEDGFHRRAIPDLDTLFSCLVKLTRILEREDTANRGGDSWLDVHRVLLPVIEEACRCHGFDTRSVLRTPLLRLQKAVTLRRDDPFRLAVSMICEQVFRHFQTLSHGLLRTRAEAIETAIGMLEIREPGWCESPRGMAERFRLLAEAVGLRRIHLEGYILPGDDSGKRMLDQRRRELVDLAFRLLPLHGRMEAPHLDWTRRQLLDVLLHHSAAMTPARREQRDGWIRRLAGGIGSRPSPWGVRILTRGDLAALEAVSDPGPDLQALIDRLHSGP